MYTLALGFSKQRFAMSIYLPPSIGIKLHTPSAFATASTRPRSPQRVMLSCDLTKRTCFKVII